MDDAGAPHLAPGPTDGRPAQAGRDGLSHLAFFYTDAGEYLERVCAFVGGGLARSEPVFAALPGRRAWRIRADLGAAGSQLAVADMDQLGRNPARITLALTSFAGQHAGRRIRVVTEPLWPGRSGAETAEVMKHEALVGLALAAVSADILCPYDAARLSLALIDGACHTHPEVIERGHHRLSSGYRTGPPARQEAALPPPPASAESLAYRSELHAVRTLAGRYAERAGLPADRRADLVLAVSEIAANTLAHTAGGGTVHIWTSGPEIICQVHDSGWITDPHGRAKAASARFARPGAVGGESRQRPGRDADRPGRHHHPAALPPPRRVAATRSGSPGRRRPGPPRGGAEPTAPPGR
jgi:MEDS: MEthanogen/methylotroph, DcmR Sensory domain/Histidine kinase-like ATPase domain